MTIRKALAAWLPVVAWMLLIFAFSAQPNSGEQSGWLIQITASLLGRPPEPLETVRYQHLVRKAAHFSEYAVLAVLLHRALGAGFGSLRRIALAVGVSALYAGSDEIHQAFVPNRGPALHDVLIDSCGALLGAAAAGLVSRWRAIAAGAR